MLSLKKDKKEEEDKDGGNQYSNLEKTSVLQEARYEFANTCNLEQSPQPPIVSSEILSKI